MSVSLMIAIGAAFLAVLYGLVMSKWISGLPAEKFYCDEKSNICIEW